MSSFYLCKTQLGQTRPFPAETFSHSHEMGPVPHHNLFHYHLVWTCVKEQQNPEAGCQGDQQNLLLYVSSRC